MRVAAEAVADRVPFVPGTGSAKLDETLELTQAAVDLGADIALVITPVLLAADAGRPVRVVRDGRPHVPRHADRAVQRADPHRGRRRTGDRRPPASRLRQRRRDQGDDQGLRALLPGASTCAVATRSCGRASSCCACRCSPSAASDSSARSPTSRRARSPRCTTTGSAAKSDEALDIHYGLHPLVDLMFVETNPAPIKSVLAAAGHIGSPMVRPPLVTPTPAGVRRIDAAARRRVPRCSKGGWPISPPPS